MLSKKRYNKMAEAEDENRVLRAIAEGIEALDRGEYISHEDAKAFLRGLKNR